jgi:hypothetical protein
MCDLSRWQPDWVAISQVHKPIAIIDPCHSSDLHREQLHAAALRKQERYSPLIYALDYCISQGWIIHVFPLVAGIRGLIHLPHIHALLNFLDTPQKHWSTTIASTVLASVKALYFLHRVRFGGLPTVTLELLEDGLITYLGDSDDTDSSDRDSPQSDRNSRKGVNGLGQEPGISVRSPRLDRRRKSVSPTLWYLAAGHPHRLLVLNLRPLLAFHSQYHLSLPQPP